MQPTPMYILFPYTTLFRSQAEYQRVISMPKGDEQQRAFRKLLELESQMPELIKSRDRKSTRLNSSHVESSYAVFCLTKKNVYLLDQVLGYDSGQKITLGVA